MKDIIYIKDLRVKTIIGIFDWERNTKQEVSIDIEFPFDCKRAAATDSIEDTIDYKTICKAIIKFVEESSFKLQESLAEGIASLVKDELNPIEDPFILWFIKLSRPENAPPQINNIFEVSTCKNSC